MINTNNSFKALIVTLLLFIGFNLNAQDKNKKISFYVKGNCEMCKSRIEKASLKLKGVKYVSWNIQSKELNLIMDENKCKVIDIKKTIAAVGHDTDETVADLKIYEALPECCKYRDPNSIHMDHGKSH
ncbi:metal transporter [Arenibacter sp. 6A1]|uniref:heavy-metal-associated domain-containing protein n=1 Tax=Arenibacter sp. 6A1 TaxID=2720391 RepID=UPI0014451602|nr:cation transporter [Arenibacter sp. 6A1]NKI27096.1 metal transporter [Arenibacter sp. 6A1]